MKSFVLVALLVSVFVCSVHGSLVCESFDAFTSGAVFSNATSYTPGTIISQGPTSIRTEFFYSKDPTLKLYDSSSVVPSFAAFGTSGNALQLTKQSIVIDFGTQLIRYVRFDFRDYGDVQDLRVNSFTLNKGSMVSMGGYVGDNIAFKPEKVRRRLINSGELFAVTGSPVIRRVWIGGDDLVIDNICWDTEAHTIPTFPVRESAANAASSVTFVASTMALVVVAAVALFF